MARSAHRRAGVASDFLSQVRVTEALGGPFSDFRARGRGQDPPDFEAVNARGEHLGIEATEIVDRKAIKASKRYGAEVWARWDPDKLIRALAACLLQKDVPEKVKGGPSDRFVLLAYTDEPELTAGRLDELLASQSFQKPALITDAYLLLSYDPSVKDYPVYQLPWRVSA